MGYRVTVDEAAGIVELSLAAPMLHDQHRAARDALIKVCTEQGLYRILIDARDIAADVPHVLDLFEFGASWKDIVRRMPVRVAGVLPADPAVRKWWGFGETAAINRGLVTRAFPDLDQAKAWLRGS